MKNISEAKVYYSDTDCYGVVWHGSYLRWFEQGRVELSRMCGIDFREMDKRDIVVPVVDMHVRYKKSAKVENEILIETELKEMKNSRIVFAQSIKDKDSGATFVTATVTVVTVDKNGKLYRKIPDYAFERYSRALVEPCAV